MKDVNFPSKYSVVHIEETFVFNFQGMTRSDGLKSQLLFC